MFCPSSCRVHSEDEMILIVDVSVQVGTLAVLIRDPCVEGLMSEPKRMMPEPSLVCNAAMSLTQH